MVENNLRMDAYYYGFDPTGVPAIDLILCAVATAGKAYHHTNSWCDECGPLVEPLRGQTPVEWIQNAANDAAELATRPTPDGGGWQDAAIAEVTKLRADLFGLCEATDDECSPVAQSDPEGKMGAYARGRRHEAKGISRAMGEMFRESLTRLSLTLGDQLNTSPPKWEDQ